MAFNKQKVRESVHVPMYQDNGTWQAIAQHRIYECYMLVLLVLNLLWLGIDADHNDNALLIHAEWHVQAVEHIFCFLFTADLILRVLAMRTFRRGFRSRTFRFDLFLVLLMVVEVW